MREKLLVWAMVISASVIGPVWFYYLDEHNIVLARQLGCTLVGLPFHYEFKP